MSFVTAPFFYLLSLTFLAYHLSWRSTRTQNLILLVASYVFYAWWDWRLLSLLIFSTAATYFGALAIERSEHDDITRRRILIVTLSLLLGTLFFFKYFNFFADNALFLSAALGIDVSSPVRFILPIGISFYTFQAIGYVVDVYRRQWPAESDYITFSAFKAFFPQLIAGPIERAGHLLAQFGRPRPINADMFREAIWLLAYGYFLKVAVADTAAAYVDLAFTPDQPLGWWTILGTMLFSVQIYADFHGYSTIAKGLALLFGFDLVWNFRFPYWATSVADFWRRWHVSLSSWLRDYLYIPLGGNRGSTSATLRNIMITMALGGLWHGANWTFVLWGLWHGMALCAQRLAAGRLPDARFLKPVYWLVTMMVVVVGWFLFRCQSFTEAAGMVGALGSMEWVPGHGAALTTLVTLSTLLVALEVFEYARGSRLAAIALPRWGAAGLIAGMITSTIATLHGHRETFLYFQF